MAMNKKTRNAGKKSQLNGRKSSGKFAPPIKVGIPCFSAHKIAILAIALACLYRGHAMVIDETYDLLPGNITPGFFRPAGAELATTPTLPNPDPNGPEFRDLGEGEGYGQNNFEGTPSFMGAVYYGCAEMIAAWSPTSVGGFFHQAYEKVNNRRPRNCRTHFADWTCPSLHRPYYYSGGVGIIPSFSTTRLYDAFFNVPCTHATEMVYVQGTDSRDFPFTDWLRASLGNKPATHVYKPGDRFETNCAADRCTEYTVLREPDSSFDWFKTENWAKRSFAQVWADVASWSWVGNSLAWAQYVITILVTSVMVLFNVLLTLIADSIDAIWRVTANGVVLFLKHIYIWSAAVYEKTSVGWERVKFAEQPLGWFSRFTFGSHTRDLEEMTAGLYDEMSQWFLTFASMVALTRESIMHNFKFAAAKAYQLTAMRNMHKDMTITGIAGVIYYAYAIFIVINQIITLLTFSTLQTGKLGYGRTIEPDELSLYQKVTSGADRAEVKLHDNTKIRTDVAVVRDDETIKKVTKQRFNKQMSKKDVKEAAAIEALESDPQAEMQKIVSYKAPNVGDLYKTGTLQPAEKSQYFVELRTILPAGIYMHYENKVITFRILRYFYGYPRYAIAVLWHYFMVVMFIVFRIDANVDVPCLEYYQGLKDFVRNVKEINKESRALNLDSVVTHAAMGKTTRHGLCFFQDECKEDGTLAKDLVGHGFLCKVDYPEAEGEVWLPKVLNALCKAFGLSNVRAAYTKYYIMTARHVLNTSHHLAPSHTLALGGLNYTNVNKFAWHNGGTTYTCPENATEKEKLDPKNLMKVDAAWACVTPSQIARLAPASLLGALAPPMHPVKLSDEYASQGHNTTHWHMLSAFNIKQSTANNLHMAATVTVGRAAVNEALHSYVKLFHGNHCMPHHVPSTWGNSGCPLVGQAQRGSNNVVLGAMHIGKSEDLNCNVAIPGHYLFRMVANHEAKRTIAARITGDGLLDRSKGADVDGTKGYYQTFIKCLGHTMEELTVKLLPPVQVVYANYIKITDLGDHCENGFTTETKDGFVKDTTRDIVNESRGSGSGPKNESSEFNYFQNMIREDNEHKLWLEREEERAMAYEDLEERLREDADKYAHGRNDKHEYKSKNKPWEDYSDDNLNEESRNKLQKAKIDPDEPAKVKERARMSKETLAELWPDDAPAQFAKKYTAAKFGSTLPVNNSKIVDFKAVAELAAQNDVTVGADTVENVSKEKFQLLQFDLESLIKLIANSLKRFKSACASASTIIETVGESPERMTGQPAEMTQEGRWTKASDAKFYPTGYEGNGWSHAQVRKYATRLTNKIDNAKTETCAIGLAIKGMHADAGEAVTEAQKQYLANLNVLSAEQQLAAHAEMKTMIDSYDDVVKNINVQTQEMDTTILALMDKIKVWESDLMWFLAIEEKLLAEEFAEVAEETERIKVRLEEVEQTKEDALAYHNTIVDSYVLQEDENNDKITKMGDEHESEKIELKDQLRQLEEKATQSQAEATALQALVTAAENTTKDEVKKARALVEENRKVTAKSKEQETQIAKLIAESKKVAPTFAAVVDTGVKSDPVPQVAPKVPDVPIVKANPLAESDAKRIENLRKYRSNNVAGPGHHIVTAIAPRILHYGTTGPHDDWFGPKVQRVCEDLGLSTYDEYRAAGNLTKGFAEAQLLGVLEPLPKLKSIHLHDSRESDIKSRPDVRVKPGHTMYESEYVYVKLPGSKLPSSFYAIARTCFICLPDTLNPKEVAGSKVLVKFLGDSYSNTRQAVIGGEKERLVVSATASPKELNSKLATQIWHRSQLIAVIDVYQDETLDKIAGARELYKAFPDLDAQLESTFDPVATKLKDQPARNARSKKAPDSPRPPPPAAVSTRNSKIREESTKPENGQPPLPLEQEVVAAP